MGKHLEEVLFFLAVFFFVYVIVGSTGDARIERACQPVHWVGDGITAVASGMGTNYTDRTKVFNENITYRCEMTLWDFFEKTAWEKKHPGQQVSAPPV
ncbi:hypothetical protein JKG47_20480 [Acidithiobacillus sp. MC6.1]|nr:hypothetical protein [Acidithiobacillus sp. MC6.1]